MVKTRLSAQPGVEMGHMSEGDLTSDPGDAIVVVPKINTAYHLNPHPVPTWWNR